MLNHAQLCTQKKKRKKDEKERSHDKHLVFPGQVISFHFPSSSPQQASSLQKELHLDWHWSRYFSGTSTSLISPWSWASVTVLEGAAISGWIDTE